MLLRLTIQNLILVQNCDLQFSPQFTVLTGETGSGKSVVLSAIGLLMGERADVDLVRHGEERALVEAFFSSKKIAEQCDEELRNTLSEYSLDDIFDTSEFSMKREISAQGKSRAFINGTIVPLHLLKKIGEKAIEFSSQHAHMAIKESNFALNMVDSLTKNASSMLEQYAKYHAEYAKQSNIIEQIKRDLEGRDEEMEKIQAHINAIEQSHIFNTDVEELFHEYSSLESKKVLFQLYSEVSDLLEGDSSEKSPIKTLRSAHSILDHGVADEEKDAIALHITAAIAELTEASFLIRKIVSKHEYSDHLLEEYSSRLSKIEKIEKQWGRDRSKIEEAFHKLKKRYDNLAALDREKENAEKEKNEIEKQLITLEEELHQERSITAQSISSAIQHELHKLNMESCQFEIEIERQPRSSTGVSKATIYITPNLGEKRIELSQKASGGEMARVFLAMQTVASSQEKIPTIIFDEVDANIGGVTAGHVGKKLAEIGKKRQIIVITHFPQVAEEADCHIAIHKTEEEGRTYTIIRKLESEQERKNEKQRMLGNR